MSRSVKDRSEFLDAASRLSPGQVTFTRDQIEKICNEAAVSWPHWLTSDKERRLARGLYSTVGMSAGSAAAVTTPKPATPKMARSVRKVPAFRPSVPTAAAATTTAGQSAVPVASNTAIPVLTSAEAASVAAMEEFTHQSLVPAKARGYVPFGHYQTLESIIRSGIFYPVFVTGLSGNGKTMMVEQICANLEREFIRVAITSETDEDDLIGGFRLIDGKTVWQDGPVVTGMRRGAIVLLDEVDLGTNKIMCLQGVLEGKPIYLKKINQIVKPLKGFNILATANTKGQGSMDGKFVGTNVLNEAFLERFAGTLEQEYPSMKVEEKILLSHLGLVLEEANLTLDAYHDRKAGEFAERLVKWADGIRKSFAEQVCTEIISTRRLVHIVDAFVIFSFNRRKAIEFCLARFDAETKSSFMDLYTKIDVEVDKLIPDAPAAGLTEPATTSDMFDRNAVKAALATNDAMANDITKALDQFLSERGV
jgi:MoxR-like ATPase